jgi:hypothetical protein
MLAMTTMDLSTRRGRYTALSNRLAHVDDRQLEAMLGAKDPSHGWGGTHVLRLGPEKVFVKRILVTQIEYENPFSTENLYGLPTFYNYGVGSAGFGAFRELVAHIKTTNWVLDGSIANFPLMYQYRVRPVSGPPPEIDEERHQRYVKYWNSDAAIDRYIRDRTSAPYEAIIFLEHIPHVLGPWLEKHPDRWETVIPELLHTITFLRSQGIVHFDAHFWNILMDGERPYLADFGLVLDKNFNLSREEQAFYRRHTEYDFAEFLSGVGGHLHSIYRRLPARHRKRVMKRFEIAEKTPYWELITRLLERIEEIHEEGLMPLDPYYVEQVLRHRSLMLLMVNFYARMGSSDKKDAPYPHAKIRRLLKESQVL